ncbi:tyrosine--tRNA ligase [Candidatus Saccharibacteria bacterium]|nr:tyrosine--tRNA ligase [Candidatus Saccharibacteria bacterium]
MKLSEELIWRGMVAEHTFKDSSELDAKKRKFYWGVDPSADSMTIGNLAAMMQAKVFIRHGYTPYLLAGGATGQIGDPKDNGERDLKTLDEIQKNVEGIKGQFNRICGDSFEIVNNADWFASINYIEFLREVGKHFSMTQLLDREFVKNRIGEGGSGISYAEFSYTLIQGYDFLHLYRTHGVDLQLCGADQFGNSVSGMHLIKRLEGAEADVWSMPLIIDPVSGRKFGKSEGNAIWLARERTNIFDFYQFWLNQPDQAVHSLLKTYTILTKPEVDEIMKNHEKNPSHRIAQKALAFGVTTVVHGEKNALAAQRATEILFQGKAGPSEKRDDLALLSEILPSHSPKKNELLVDAIANSQMTSSKSEARRLIKGGGVALNGEKITDENAKTEPGILKLGKNKFLIIK